MVDGAASEQRTMRVFISYNRRDEQTYGLVKHLSQHLSNRFYSQTGDELSLFIDTGMPGGIEWEKAIKRAVGATDFMLCLLSVGYLKSEHCRHEVNWFLEGRETTGGELAVVPITLIPPEALSRRTPDAARPTLTALGKLNWIDASAAIDAGFMGSQWPTFLRRLVDDSLVPAWEAMMSEVGQTEESAELHHQDLVARHMAEKKFLEQAPTRDLALDLLACVPAGVAPARLAEDIETAFRAIRSELDQYARPLQSADELRAVASTAAGDSAIGALIAKAIDAVGSAGHVFLRQGEPEGVDSVEGHTFQTGTAAQGSGAVKHGVSVLHDVEVLLFDGRITDRRQLETLAGDTQSRLLVVAAACEPQLVRAVPQVTVVTPRGGPRLISETLEDLTVIVGGAVNRQGQTQRPSRGRADTVQIGPSMTTLSASNGDLVPLLDRIDVVKHALAAAPSEHERLGARLAMLSGGAATITIRTTAAESWQRRMDRARKGLAASRPVADQGYVAGEGVALARAALIARLRVSDERVARTIVNGATARLRARAQESGLSAAEILKVASTLGPEEGIDFRTGQRAPRALGALEPMGKAIEAFYDAMIMAKTIVLGDEFNQGT